MTRTLLLAGGGSGGHVFPLLAVAEALNALAPDVRLLFVGTERGMESKLVPQHGYELELLRVKPLRGAGLPGALSGVQSAASAVLASRSLLRNRRPHAVLSIGGYAAGPISLAAWAMGIPLALIEPNAEIGLSNRLVAPLVTRAYTAFPESARFFRPSAVFEAGVPLRAGFSARPPRAQGSPANVLVLGGSQGAKTLNEALPRALARVEQPISVLHQAGARNEQATRELYAELGLADRVKVTPFIENMADALGEADLVVGRAGAGAVSEICAIGRASLFIPYPFAGDHQRFNAHSLERRGAALTVLAQEATSERLQREISALLADRTRLCGMAERARELGRPLAARAIAEDFLRVAGLTQAGDRAPSPSKVKAPSPMRFEAQELF